jgi:[citrate (pro-3S)-lyase] ligase
MVVQLTASADQARARAFIEAQGLGWEAGCQDLVGAFEDGALVAAGGRDGDVLKMIAIDEDHRSGSLLGELVGELTRLGIAAGHDGFFVYTRPPSAGSFEALNFRLLASHGQAALLESGGRFQAWLEHQLRQRRTGPGGAVVVNCNPFTLGHQWLIEQAAARLPTLYAFVVREDRSAFPFEDRLRMVREGTRHLPNVVVLDTGRYAVSAVTFPAYFLAKGAPLEAIQLELDVALFGGRIAPPFGVTHRFFGTEPGCATTRAYNEALCRVLPSFGVTPVELARREADGAYISASSVRDALARDDLPAVARLVPPSTMDYLRSPGGRAIASRLAAGRGSNR